MDPIYVLFVGALLVPIAAWLGWRSHRRSILRQIAVLQQLLDGEKFGMELHRGAPRLLRRAGMYVHLGQMEDAGLIVGFRVPDHRTDDVVTSRGRILEPGPGRRKYRITVAGRAWVAAAPDLLHRSLLLRTALRR